MQSTDRRGAVHTGGNEKYWTIQKSAKRLAWRVFYANSTPNGFKSFPWYRGWLSLSTFVAWEDHAWTSKARFVNIKLCYGRLQLGRVISWHRLFILFCTTTPIPNSGRAFKHLLSRMKRCVWVKGIGREKSGNSNETSAGHQHSPSVADTGNGTRTGLNCRAPLPSTSAISLAPDPLHFSPGGWRTQQQQPKHWLTTQFSKRNARAACLAQLQTYMTTTWISFGLPLVMAGMAPLPSFTSSLPQGFTSHSSPMIQTSHSPCKQI